MENDDIIPENFKLETPVTEQTEPNLITLPIRDGDGTELGTLTLPADTSQETWAELLSVYIPKQPTWDNIRKIRDKLFDQTIWMMQRHQSQLELGTEPTLTDEKYEEWLIYWQALRDLPQAQALLNPKDVLFPDKPA